jgi:hypothetical protein
MSLRLRFYVLALSAVVLASLWTMPAASAASPHHRSKPKHHRPPIATGIYQGSNSQGFPLKYRIVAHSSTNKCGRSRNALCLMPMEPWAVTMTLCNNNDDPIIPLELSQSLVSETGSGTFNWIERHEEGVIHWVHEFSVHVSHESARGTMRTSQQYLVSIGNEPPIACDSGVVTFAAHLI